MSKIYAGLGLSTEKDPVRAAQEAVHQAKTSFHSEKVSLAIVFCSTDLSHSTLLKTISIHLENTPIIGCSGAAIISSYGITKHGIVILLLGFPEDVFCNTGHVREIGTKTSLVAGQELGEKLIYGFQNVRRDLSIIFSDGLIKEGSNLIHGLQLRLGYSFPLIGASASDNMHFSRTCLHFNQTVFNDGACGLLLGGKVRFGLGVKHGWQPLGKLRKVTRSKDNVVYQIDGAPAVRLYEEYFAYNIAELKKELKHISVLYPIGIYLSGEKEYLLRNIIAIEEDGSLVFQGDVPENSDIRLMIGTKESCLDAAKQALSEAKNRLTGYDIYFILVFDSISRYILLGRNAFKELEAIKEVMGREIPIIGFYTFGEQAPLTAINYRGRSYFHNQTFTVLAIGG
ncbi:MAG: FIST N-terminal domain-containing protein [Candidatus Omnitrophica bacterium]|nr:FIST N-terminal domain-containing protein [Candidatus Omnitrophota bacterium]MDD5512664.1 FIST N-terminal domain-containing protein [Candidatus Omnitrophota bacterium]